MKGKRRIWLDSIWGISLILLHSCSSPKILSTPFNALPCVDWNQYGESATQHKRIDLVVHFFQDENGEQNLNPLDDHGEKTGNYYWFEGLIFDINNRFKSMVPLRLGTDNVHVENFGVELNLVDCYEWRSNDLWATSGSDFSSANKLYQHVISQTNVQHTENAVHLLVPGASNIRGGAARQRGRASGIGDYKWILLLNVYQKMQQGEWPAGMMAHEIGHSLGLRHTWNESDGCDDTPQNRYHLDNSPRNFQCWNLDKKDSKCDEESEVSNNLMDYNSVQNAITICQNHRVHHHLLGYRGSIHKAVSSIGSFPEPHIEQANHQEELTFTLENHTYGVPVRHGIVNGKGQLIHEGCGNVLHIPKSNGKLKGQVVFELLYPDGSNHIEVMKIKQRQSSGIQ